MVIISTGGFLFPETAAYMMAGYHFPHLLNVETAAKIKQGVSLPVSVVGGITTIDEAEEILAAGKVDIVAMAKALIADQDLVTKARLGKADDIRPCLRCLECAYGGLIGTPLRCAVNPQAGREVKYREIPLARRKKTGARHRRRSRGHDGRPDRLRARPRRDPVGEVATGWAAASTKPPPCPRRTPPAPTSTGRSVPP